MGVRRFLNLFVTNRPDCMYSLRRFDLSRNQFFYATPEEVALHGRVLPPIRRDSSSSLKMTKRKKNQLAASEIPAIRLPAPLFNMRLAQGPRPMGYKVRLDAFALSERNIMFADGKRQVFTYDTDSSCLVAMPSLHAPKVDPLAISIPRTGGGEGSMYMIERQLRPEKSFQFEALVSREQHSNASNPFRTWECQELPLLPLEEEMFVGSCAVVGNLVCISSSGFGTYCFDTVSHSWSRAGDWALPFFGTAETAAIPCPKGSFAPVPEHNLWFGVSDQDYHLACAADLSPVLAGQQPEPGLVWPDNYLPEEWYHTGIMNPARMISLGSGRFCMIRFLETRMPSLDAEQIFVDQQFAVFTGLEAVKAGKGNGNRIRMVRHKSRRCRNISSSFIECFL
ncbi:hypothetical protein ACQ4PT_025640 [Festuca glaucescens]